ncbi:MAG: cob(I)yrinic acid a,c-diamide adenosyltransferase [Candidatus Bilamarchaeaceae archaeon]
MPHIYTKFGDGGQTSLLGGKKVDKDSPRIEACGQVDELNASLGIVCAHSTIPEIKSQLESAQKTLFEIGAELASEKPRKRLSLHKVSELEEAIDKLELALPPLTHFIIPGGSKEGALLHYARTVCRRVERRIVAISKHEKINSNVVVYLNRLGDLLFMLARCANSKHRKEDRIWKEPKLL